MEQPKAKIYKVILTKDGSFCEDRTKVFFVKQGDIIRATLSSRKFRDKMPILLTNLDLIKKSRSRFMNLVEIVQPIKLSRNEIQERYDCYFGTFDQEGTWSCDVTMPGSGSYFLQIIFVSVDEFKNLNTINISDFGRPEWIVVEPQLSINGALITSKHLTMQTLLSRNMGPLDRWDKLIEMQASLGYNCFHITPIQRLGGSESLYAIADQLEVADYILPKSNNKEEAFKRVKSKVHEMAKKYNCLFFGEVVLNHTSYDSEWLQDCPNACYNLQNTPQLTSAYVLDNALQQFSRKIAKGEVKEYTKKLVENEDDLKHILNVLENQIIKPLNLHEYFMIDVAKIKASFIEFITKSHPELKVPEKYFEDDEDMFNIFKPEKLSTLIGIIEKNLTNVGAKKFGVEVDLKSVAKYYVDHPQKGSIEQLEMCLQKLNQQLEKMARGYIQEALASLENTIRYQKLERKEYEVSAEKPLVHPYFGHLPDGTPIANNGWIWSGDPTEDFAVSKNFYYLRRGIVIWGDLVKLRFGSSKKDCPPLWRRMKHYVQKTAEIFDGLRLDNAHSTPIHVAEYLVRKGRKVNPRLYVFSELFTGSSEKDALFTKRIAVNALVREALQQFSPHDLCGSIYHYSQGLDVAVGSLDPYTESDPKTNQEVYILKPRIPDALFYDLTHDNVSYHERRTFMDSLSTAALLAMSNCFVATTKGFDEFFPQNLSVITEKRLYPIVEDPLQDQCNQTESGRVIFTYNEKPEANHVELRGNWDDWARGIHLKKTEKGSWRVTADIPEGTHFYKYIVDDTWVADHTKPIFKEGGVENNILQIQSEVRKYSNMWPVRNELNRIHQKIAVKYPEFYIDEITSDIISISRENVKKTKSFVMVTRTAFSHGSDDVDVTINLPGRIQHFHLIAYAESTINKFPDDKEFIYGLDCNVSLEKDISKFADVLYDQNTQSNYLKFFKMPPGFVCIIHVILNLDQMLAVKELEDLKTIDKTKLTKELTSKLTPADINYLLFSCETEERDRTGGAHGTYVLPNYGELHYAGFGAFFKILKDARLYNNLGIPLFDNLRNGNWLLDFLLRRLENVPRYRNMSLWLAKYFSYLKIIPRHLVPKYFTRIMDTLYSIFMNKINQTQNLEGNIENAHFFKRLLLSCYEFVGDVPSGYIDEWKTTLAAGLPHFATGWARCWGRDTFISFKGALLVPGLYDIAKSVILMFATCLRHGLLPNLLDAGRNSRYNCRDAAWYFVKAVKDYTEFTNDYTILKSEVRIRYLSDNKQEHENKQLAGEVKVLTLEDVVQEIFASHARGIKYREWNAGHSIDEKMTYDGFNVDLSLDETTGFIFGGNSHNCLTWMDKMGSSDKAKTTGVPGSSRDGAPIEMTALLKCGLNFVIAANSKGHYKYKTVKTSKGEELSFRDWSDKIKANFEKHYWIPGEVEQFKDFALKPYAVRRKGIYKDTVGAQKETQDYYFRPNGCIAIAVAPELFTKERAIKYLQTVETVLIKENSLGIKTLDPKERIYVPYYDNANDSDDPLTAHGFSYHNGPEWVWIFGSFLTACLNVYLKDTNMVVLMSYLTNHKLHIENTDWSSLPEMTNDDGGWCPFSCSAQTWSIATILETVYDAQQIFKGKGQSVIETTSSSRSNPK